MSTPGRAYLLAYLALGVGVLSVAFSAIFVRQAGAPGTVVSFYRMAIPVLLLAWPFYQRASVRGGLPRRGISIALLGGLLFAGDLALWASGVMLSGATTPTLLSNTAPVWVGLGALLFFRESLSARFWAGLALAMGGAVLILGLDTLTTATLGLGAWLGLMSAIFYGGYFLVTQRARASLDPLTYFWLAAFSSSLALLAISLVLRQPLTGYSSFAYLNFLGLGIVVQIVGWLAINYAQGYLPASAVSSTMLGQPVVTAGLAALLLGERLSAWHMLGGAMVLAGVYVVHRSRQKSREPEVTGYDG